MFESVFHNEPFAFANNNVKTFESIKINKNRRVVNMLISLNIALENDP